MSRKRLLEEAESLPVGSCEVDVNLCPTAVLAQACHDLGILGEEHIGSQLYRRLCMQVLGLPDTAAEEDEFDALRAYCETMQIQFGMGAANLLCGAGRASAPDLSGYDYASRLNTGAYHPDTIRRGFSAPDLRTGQPLLHDVLNFMTAARRAKTTYLHSPFKRVALAVTSIDGLMIKCGLMTDESSADNFGFVEGPLNVRTSKQLSVMNDDELRAYLAKHELATEMEEVMIATEAWRSDYDASAIVGRVRKFNVVENSLDRVAVVAVPASEWDRLHDMWEASENDAERSDASSDSSADLDAGESRLGRKRTRPRFFDETG